jgi:O-antigen ligase
MLNKTIDPIYYKIIDYIILLLPFFFFLGPAAINFVLFFFSFLFLFFSIKKNNWTWLSEDYTKVFIFFWIYVVILSLFSNSVFESFKSAFFLIKFFLFFLLISFYAFKKINLNYILKIWFLFVLFLCFDIYYQYIFGRDIIFSYPVAAGERYSAFFGEELIAASFIAQITAPIIGFFFYFVFLVNNNFYIKLLLLLSLAFVFFATIITGERMNTVFLFSLLLLTAALFNFLRKKNFFFILFLLAILLISILSFKNIKAIEARYVDFGHSISSIYNSSHGKLFNSAYRLWLKKPLTGWGLKNYRVVCDKELKDINLKTSYDLCSTHPHNLYLELLSETGLIGFILYFLFIFFFIKKILTELNYKKKYNEGHSIIFSCLISISLMLFPFKSAGSFATSWNGTFFWLLFGLILNRLIFLKKST